MTELARVVDDLREIHAELSRVEILIQKHPEYPSLSLDYGALEKRRKELEASFAAISNLDFLDICNYRLIPENENHYPLSGMSRILGSFQDLFTTVFDAVRTGQPKKRARPSAETVQLSSLNFAYSFPGSLGFALTIPNDRMLAAESDLDKAIAYSFGLMKAESSDQIADISELVGIASVKQVDRWAESHASYALNARIRWERGEAVRNQMLIQIPQIERLRHLIESQSEEEVESLRLIGSLVGIDVAVGTFHMSFPEGQEIRGKLAPSYQGGEPAEVPGRYQATILKRTRTFYSTRTDEVSYQLTGLRPIGRSLSG